MVITKLKGNDVIIDGTNNKKQFVIAVQSLDIPNYGTLAGLSARSIFVIDENGVVTYKQLVPEITEKSNYDEILEIVK